MKATKAIWLTWFAIVFVMACTNEPSTTETLRKAGYTEIKTGGWDPLACSDGDFFATRFRATNPTGTNADGTVCCGFLLKGCTIRH